MLREIQIGIDNLLLDPNNPRFVRDLTELNEVPDDRVVELQEATLDKFDRTRPRSDDEDAGIVSIRDLYESMCRIGFVGIDRIVVRPLQGTDKYLVLEGNRRIATVKSILRDLRERSAPLNSVTAQAEVSAHQDSFENIRAMLLDTAGLPKEEIARRVAVLLGIRHHGSVLEWELLPKAYNIYTEYMEEAPNASSFEFDNRKAKAVANRLCIQVSDVKRALRTYVAYLQVRERFPEVKDDHFSLIEYNVIDKTLGRAYYEINEDTFELDENSLTKLNAVSQFSTRDSNSPELTTDGKKKILRDPKQTKLLGRLVAAVGEPHDAVKEYARDLIKRVEDEDDLDVTLEEAVDALTAFKKRAQWVSAINQLLDKQEAELTLESYQGEGLDRGRKDELKTNLEPIRRILGL